MFTPAASRMRFISGTFGMMPMFGMNSWNSCFTGRIAVTMGMNRSAVSRSSGRTYEMQPLFASMIFSARFLASACIRAGMFSVGFMCLSFRALARVTKGLGG